MEVPTDVLEVDVYASRNRADYYLYVAAEAVIEDCVPEPLRKRLGMLRKALTLTLAADTRLARAHAAQVLEAIREQGFYLQLPPNPVETGQVP
ncbi:MAG: YcgL domain-containing protein [Pseudomonadota bacterium]